VTARPLEECGVLVVGGTAGIGYASARSIAHAGARRVLLVGRDTDRGEDARARLASESGADVFFLQADATRADEAARIAVYAEEALGGIDVLVCSTVATAIPTLFHDIPTDAIEGIVTEMLMPPMQIVSAALPAMRRRGSGSVILVASDAGKTATPGETIIGACKAAIIMFARTVALEAKRDGVRVNVMTPSLVHGTASTERITTDGFSARLFARAAEQASLGVPDADDLGALAAFLAGPGSSKLTGQAISVNGGISAA
jgi:NAD(P)-dependent dehydrogenase (short-subunit alcohol dehydrogenase family)